MTPRAGSTITSNRRPGPENFADVRKARQGVRSSRTEIPGLSLEGSRNIGNLSGSSKTQAVSRARSWRRYHTRATNMAISHTVRNAMKPEPRPGLLLPQSNYSSPSRRHRLSHRLAQSVRPHVKKLRMIEAKALPKNETPRLGRHDAGNGASRSTAFAERLAPSPKLPWGAITRD